MLTDRLTYRLIADLFDELERVGAAPPPGKYLQVQELLRRLPADTPPERLRTLLAPIVATDAAGQRQFYELFTKSLAQAQSVQDEDLPGEELPDDPAHTAARSARRRERRWRRVVLLFPLLLAALAGFAWDRQLGNWYVNPTDWWAAAVLTGAAWAAWRLLDGATRRGAYLLGALLLLAAGARLKSALAPAPTPPASRTIRFTAAAGDTVLVDLRNPADTARLLHAAPAAAVETPLGGRFWVDSSSAVATYIADPSAQAGWADSLLAWLAYAGRTDTVYAIADLLEKPAPPPPPDTNLIAEAPLPYPRDIAEIRVDPDEAARFAWYRRYEWPLKALAAFLLGALAWALVRWDRYRRARAVAELRRADRAPYVWNPDPGADPAADALAAAVQPLFTRLRGRAPDERLRLDLSASIRSTSRRAGRVIFAWRRRTLPPDYLFLIDRLAPNDHRARLFDGLYQAFRSAEVPVVRYFFDGDPRRCFNDAQPNGIALAELLHRHPGAQLFIVGEGEGLLALHTGRPAPWTALLDAWPRRALLTPRPLRAWGAAERQLAELLPLLPASPGGIAAALDHFAAETPGDTRDLPRQVRDALEQPFEFDHELLADLGRQFDPAVVDWIAACALWPSLHWDLTLHLGRALSERLGVELLRFDHLRELTRLPWFTEGRLPDGARAALLDHLAARGLETPLRTALGELLRQTPAPPDDSAAYDDYRMNVVLNELFLRPDPATRRRLEREFERYLAAGKKPDFVALRLLDRPATRLDVLVGDRLKKYAFREGLPGLGWRLAPKLLGIWLALAGAITWFQPQLNPCPGERVRAGALEVCLNSDRDRLVYLEYLAGQAVAAQDHARVDSLRAAADAILLRDTAFYQNTATRYFNQGAAYFNSHQLLDEFGFIEDSLRSLACDNFRRGGDLFAALTGAEGFRFHDAMLRACPGADTAQAAVFAFSGRVLAAATGRPLAGVEVRAGNAGSVSDADLQQLPRARWAQTGIYADTTGSDGRYTLRIPARALGTLLRLRTTAPGYAPATARVTARDPLPDLELSATGSGPAANCPQYQRLLYESERAMQQAQYRLALNKLQSARVYCPEKSAEVDGLITTLFNQLAQLLSQSAPQMLPDIKFSSNGPACSPTYSRLLEEARLSWKQNNILAAFNKLNSARRLCPEKSEEVDWFIGAMFDALEALLQAGRADDAAWQRARAAGTPEACRQYLTAYPQGRHAAEAQACTAAPAALEITMVPVPGGSFLMGCRDSLRDGDCSDAEKPAHQVTLRDFNIGKYEVTQAEWRRVMGSDPPGLGSKGCDQCPVESVSWDDVQAFTQKLNALTGKNYRLPTEAEWEYAARGGNRSKAYLYSGGNDLNEVAWNGDNSDLNIYPVGQLKPNELGIYDMSGNVYEWVDDDWHDSYNGAPADGNAWTDGAKRSANRVRRGGSCCGGAEYCRVSCRERSRPVDRFNNLGFRLALSLQ